MRGHVTRVGVVFPVRVRKRDNGRSYVMTTPTSTMVMYRCVSSSSLSMDSILSSLEEWVGQNSI